MAKIKTFIQNDLGGIFMVPKTDKQPFQDEILPLYKSDWYRNNSDFIKVVGWRNKTVDDFNAVIRGFIFGLDLPKIVVGDRLVADASVVEDNKVMISTNEEMIVLAVEIATEELSAEYIIKYYKIRVKVLDRVGIYDEFMLRIIHEDSEAVFDRICLLQATVAKMHPKGSYKAKTAWIDYYDFVHHWHKVKYSYAITAHKAQGSTYNTAYVLAWDIMASYNIYQRNRILYTACTRPSRNLFIEY